MERADKDRLRELVKRVDDGTMTAGEAVEEAYSIAPYSIIASMLTVRSTIDGFRSDRITAGDAAAIIHEQADLHPTMYMSFMACSAIAMQQKKADDAFGYMVLAWKKSMIFTGDVVTWKLLGRAAPLEQLLAWLEEDDEQSTVWPYLGECSDHVVDHFLVQDVVSPSEEYVDPDELELVISRGESVAPILAGMCGDLLYLDEPAPNSWRFLAAILGYLRPIEAVSPVVEGLTTLTGNALHESVLTAAKLGSAYPAEVSAALKDMISYPDYGEVRFYAIEALGLLWREEGNLEFLIGALKSLDPSDTDFLGMHGFITWALLHTCEPGAVSLVSASLDTYGTHLPDDVHRGVRGMMERMDPKEEDRRLECLLNEDPFQLCCGPLDMLSEEMRITLTIVKEMFAVEGLAGGGVETTEAVPPEWSGVGRNEPCPCGSGRKFKKCCLEKVEQGKAVHAARATGEEEADLDEIMLLMEAVMTFSKAHRFRSEARAAAEEFLSSSGRKHFEVPSDDEETSTEHNLFIDWFLLTRPLTYSGKTILEEFWEQRGAMLPAGIRDLAEGLMDSRFSVYEVQVVFPEEGLLMRDLFRHDTVRVREKLATRSLVRWDMVAVRVGPVGGHYEMLRTPFRVPREFRGKVVGYVKRKCRELKKKGEVEGMDDFLQLKGYTLFDYVSRLVSQKPPPVLLTAEGDMLCFCSAAFDIKDQYAATRILEENPYIEEEDYGVPAQSTGPRRYAWFMSPGVEKVLRSGSHIGDPHIYEEAVGWEKLCCASAPGETDDAQIGPTRRYFGNITMTGKRLIFETNSRERLERAKEEFLGMMPGLLVHRVDTIQDQEVVLEEIVKEHDTEAAPAGGTGASGWPAPGRPPARIDTARIDEKLIERLERHYRSWPDHPLPALGGRTPREAARTNAGRRKVDELLKDFENRAESGPSGGQVAYDFSILRDELGIWPEGFQQGGDRDAVTGRGAYRVQGEWREEPESKLLLPETRLVPALNKLPVALSKGICVELGLPVLPRAKDRAKKIAGFLQRHESLEGMWKRLPQPSRRVLRWLVVEQGGFATMEELTGVFGLNRDDSRDEGGAPVTPLGLLRLNGLVYVGEAGIEGLSTRIAAVPVELRENLELIASEESALDNAPPTNGPGSP